MGSSRMARRRRSIHAATIRRAVSRTSTAATSTRNRPRPRNNENAPRSEALNPKQTRASNGKKAWTRTSTPIQRPKGIDQPRMQLASHTTIVVGRGSVALPLCWFRMRIIAGQYRSRTLEAPAGLGTRPTSDRLRETLFNVLAPRIEGAAFLDLYAGSGAVGIEALSRGAASVTFVERAPAALLVLRANLARLGVCEGFRIPPGSVAGWLRGFDPGPGPGPKPGSKRDSALASKPERNSVLSQAFDLVFLDPPYDAAEEYAAALGDR